MPSESVGLNPQKHYLSKLEARYAKEKWRDVLVFCIGSSVCSIIGMITGNALYRFSSLGHGPEYGESWQHSMERSLMCGGMFRIMYFIIGIVRWNKFEADYKKYKQLKEKA